MSTLPKRKERSPVYTEPSIGDHKSLICLLIFDSAGRLERGSIMLSLALDGSCQVRLEGVPTEPQNWVNRIMYLTGRAVVLVVSVQMVRKHRNGNKL